TCRLRQDRPFRKQAPTLPAMSSHSAKGAGRDEANDLFVTKQSQLVTNWLFVHMRFPPTSCLGSPPGQWFQAGGERPARWDFWTDRRRRCARRVPVFG